MKKYHIQWWWIEQHENKEPLPNYIKYFTVGYLGFVIGIIFQRGLLL